VLRKLVSGITVVVLSILGLGQASPAQAWPDFTVPSNSRAVDVQGAFTLPVGKTVTSDAVFVYVVQPQDDSTRYVKSYTVTPSGEISDSFTISFNTTEANYLLSQKTIWTDISGKFNVVYWSWDETVAGLESKLYHSTSSDGKIWSTEILETFLGSSPECRQSWCGIRSAQLTQNALGTAALTYVLTETPEVSKLYFRTKPLGKAWTAKAALNTSTGIQDSITMKPFGKGWLAAWSQYGAQETTMYSAYSTGDRLSTWTAPQLRDSAACSVPRNIMQISPTKYALIYLSDCQEGSPNNTYKYQAFDLSTKRFAQAQLLDTVPNRGWSNTYETAYRGGQSAFGYSIYSYQENEIGFAKYILFRNGVPSVQFINEAAASEGGTQILTGMNMDLSGHLTVVWTSYSGSRVALTISQIYRGTRADIDAPIASVHTSEYPVVFSPDGDIYISDVTNSNINAIERIRSDAPDIEGTVAVTGKAKANSVVSSKLPRIKPSQLLQSWKNSYQWLACDYQVPEAATNPPVSCSEIVNANAATYKVKTADRGKYLVVKVSVKSDNATQVLYSPSTSVVK
jgi:hypothetical protein